MILLTLASFAALIGAAVYTAPEHTVPPRPFMVIYLDNKVAGSIGPLPYDMKRCLARRLEPIGSEVTAWSFVHHGITRRKDGITALIRCEEHMQAPTLER